ncbi:uncharacterized protein PV06_09770 [Exophiala oligosperma]|uniref:Magnesium transporter n=1 Tax=Exophiala oligosperma TaxID=215243 RepID=A0A0D2ABS9_9EURO|nr:uncharacterized protein PV06_09770 [Exophiala oligosperma]KIW37781.1 hypothetical protein PV06_09770 [Exophiala oligosperma]
MSFISRMLVLVGLLSLFHAAYSAHEFSTLSTRFHKPAPLPLDIKLETLISVFLACFGLILGSESLKPVSWSAWAGKVEQDGEPNPFHGLEERVGFMDIRAQRSEFSSWARSQGSGSKS